MAEPEKDQIGDGQDNFGQAAGKAIQAAKQISHDAAAEAAVKGAEATANTAAAVVQAGAESGKAISSPPSRVMNSNGPAAKSAVSLSRSPPVLPTASMSWRSGTRFPRKWS